MRGRLGVVAFLCLLLPACTESPSGESPKAPDGAASLADGGASSPDVERVGGGDAAAGAPLLTSVHMGYKRQDCTLCHQVPLPGHTEANIGNCATCHGGNGACDPNGEQSARLHQPTDDCMGCHGNRHELHRESSACVNCHFAFAGTDTLCGIDSVTDAGADSSPRPDAGSGVLPLPETQLVSNCYNWPAQEFAPGNSASEKAVLPAGSRAIDFTLADVDGNKVTLSALLATKPVVLVTGSFT